MLCKSSGSRPPKLHTLETPKQGMMKNTIKIRKIEHLPARQVTFSKRRRGIFKKAAELSVLCESEVAVVIFSATGKLYDYSSTSTKDVIARYKAYTGNGEQSDRQALELQLENENRIRLGKEIADKSRELRHLNGEDLADLDLDELQELEKTIEAGLSRVLKAKEEKITNEIMQLERKEEKITNEIMQLERKGEELVETNFFLRQRMVMLSNRGNRPGLLEPDHNLITNNDFGVAEEDGMSSESATSITCNNNDFGVASMQDAASVGDLSLQLGLT